MLVKMKMLEWYSPLNKRALKNMAKKNLHNIKKEDKLILNNYIIKSKQ